VAVFCWKEAKEMKLERIHIELTNQCNFACEFCPDSIMTRKRGNMEFPVLTKIIDEISEERLTETVLFHVMGEPLLYPDLFRAVAYAKGKGLKVCLTTNGWLMSDIVLKKLLKEHMDHIIFSVQTPDASTFRLRRTKINFDEYCEKIVSCIVKILSDSANKTKVTLSFLVTPWKNIFLPNNKMSIIDSKDDLCGYLSIWLERILNRDCNGTVLDKIKNRLKQIEIQIKKMNMLGWNQLKITDNFMLETRMLGDWIHPGLSSDRIKKAYFGACEGLTEHIGILWNGDLVFCCVDFDGRTKFGNMKSTRIKDAFQKKEIRKIIKGLRRFCILHPYCQRCLGDVSLVNSIVRQFGSVFYFKFYRKWWKAKRHKAQPVIK